MKKTFPERYSNNHHIRAIVKALPRGAALDYWLCEIAKKNSSHVASANIYAVPEGILKKICEHLLSKINFEIHIVPLYEDPKLIKEGSFTLPVKYRSRAQDIEHDLTSSSQPNDPCAVIVSEPNWDDKPVSLHYMTAYYAEVRAIHECGARLSILSGNALLFCEETQCLVLHRRSKKSYDFPDKLHTFGGGYIPEGISDKGDIFGIRECVERELREETGVPLLIPATTPLAIIDEQGIQFIQTVYLGVNITKEHLKRLRANWEGDVVQIEFAKLEQRLMNLDDWLPSGWAHVVLWLAMGAPGSQKSLSFNGMQPDQVVERLLS